MAEQVELDISIDALKKDLQDLQKELLKTGEAGDKSFSGVAKEVEALSQEVKDLAAVEREASAATQQADKAVGGFGTRVKNAILNTQVFGKTIGEWGGQLGGLSGRLASGEAGTGKLAGAFRLLSTVIKASGLGLLIGIVTSLIGYFSRFQSGVDKVSQVMASVNAVADVLIGRFVKLGSSVLNFVVGVGKFLTGDSTGAMESFGQAADDARASVSGIGDELVNTAKAAYELEAQFQKIRSDLATFEVTSARRRVELEALKAISDDETRTLGRRAAAAQSAGKIERELAQEAYDLALRAREAAAKDFQLNTENAEKKEAFRKAELDLIEKGKELNGAVYDAEQKQREFRKQAAEERQKQLKKEVDDLEKLRKDIEKLRVEGQEGGIDKDLAEVNRKYDALIKTAQDGVAKLNEIEKRRGLTPEEQARRVEFANLSLQLEERRLSALLDVVADYAEKDIEIERELREQKDALAKGDYDRAVASLEREKNLREQQISIGEEQAKAFVDRLKQQGASKREIEETERDFDLLAQQARLRAELDFQEKLLEITKTTNPQRAEEIRKSIELLKKQLENVDFKIENPEPGKASKRSILDLLGIDPNYQDEFKAAVAESINLLQELSAARLAEAQAAVDAADAKAAAAEKSVDAAQNALDEQLRVAELGFSSNVDAAQKDLAAAKQQQVEAEKQQKQALANQQKVQRQQIIQDSLLQVSNLATAGTNIFKALSAFGPIGVGLAIASIGLMIGAFIKSKAAALKAVNAQKFRTGGEGHVREDGVIAGPSHEKGGVKVPEYEGGEFFTSDGKRFAVVNRKMTTLHYELLRATNKDDRPAMARYIERLTGGVSRDEQSTGAVVETVRDRIVLAAGRSDRLEQLAETNNRLAEENNRLTQKLLTIEQEREQVTDMGDHYRIVKGGRVTTLRKRG
jgi:hypothetical protein